MRVLESNEEFEPCVSYSTHGAVIAHATNHDRYRLIVRLDLAENAMCFLGLGSRAAAVIRSMMNRDLSAEEHALFQLLAGLVTGSEDRTVKIPPAPQYAILRYPLKSSGMKQTELAELWGAGKGYTSGIVNGKRPIPKAQANLLAQRLKVSVA